MEPGHGRCGELAADGLWRAALQTRGKTGEGQNQGIWSQVNCPPGRGKTVLMKRENRQAAWTLPMATRCPLDRLAGRGHQNGGKTRLNAWTLAFGDIEGSTACAVTLGADSVLTAACAAWSGGG